MLTFEFRVKQRTMSPGVHSWVAIEVTTGIEIPLPRGGQDKFVGSYPEIEAFLRERDGLEISLVYESAIDFFEPDGAGNTTWTYVRVESKVIVNDIQRVVGSLQMVSR